MESFVESALRLAPRDINVLITAGNARTNSGRIAEATALYQQARELDPRNRRVHMALHGGLLQSGRIAESIEAAEGAIALGETSVGLHAGLVRARLARGGGRVWPPRTGSRASFEGRSACWIASSPRVPRDRTRKESAPRVRRALICVQARRDYAAGSTLTLIRRLSLGSNFTVPSIRAKIV